MNKALEFILYLLCALIIPPLAVALYRGVDDGQFWVNFILFLVFWPVACIHAIVLVCMGKPKPKEGSQINIYPNRAQMNQIMPQDPNAIQGYQVTYTETKPVTQPTPQYPNEKQSVVNSSVSESSSAANNQRSSSTGMPPPTYEEKKIE